MFKKKTSPVRHPAIELAVGIDKLTAAAETAHLGIRAAEILEEKASAIRATMAVRVTLASPFHSGNI